MKKHFVTFYSPGTFFAETSELPINSWDVDRAVQMAHKVMERYNATPYGFRFSTRSRGENDLDSKTIKTSPMYHLGGTVLTVKEIEARNDPKNAILISNMKSNGWKKVVENTNSWRSVQPLGNGDVVLDFKPKKRREATNLIRKGR